MRVSSLPVAGAVCLVAGAAGQLVEYGVTPLNESDDTAAQVASAAAHLGRMRAATWLDLLLLLLIPAAAFMVVLAGGLTSRLAMVGAGLVTLSSLGAGYLLAADVVVLNAAGAGQRNGASLALADGYLHAGPVEVVVGVYLVGHVVGFVLLGTAVTRARVLPRWAGGALMTWPVLELVGEATKVKPLAAAAFALLLFSYAAAAALLLRGNRAPVGDRLVSVDPATVSATAY